jgi:hypothetical protein
MVLATGSGTTHGISADRRNQGETRTFLVSGNGTWIEVYNCLGTLNRLKSAIMSADLLRGWKVNPLGLLQEAVSQLQNFQEPSLESFPLQLQLLSNDLENLIKYSLP